MNTLYLRFLSPDIAQIEIALKTSEGLQHLDSIPKSNRYKQVVVFLPSSCVAYHYLTPPTSNKKQQKAAIPFMLETQLSQEIKQAYYVYKPDGDKIKVCVIEKSIFNKYQELLTQLKLSADFLVSESEGFSSLVNNKNDWHILHTKTHLIACGYQQNLCLYKNIAPSVLKNLEGKQSNYGQDDDNFGVLDFLIQHLQPKASINLLDSLIADNTLASRLKPYAFSLLLMVLCLLAMPGYLWLETQQAQQKIEQTNTQMIKLYAQTYPKANSIIDPYQQLLSKSKKQGSRQKSEFLPILLQLEKSQDKRIKIESLRFNKQGLTLKVSSNKIGLIDNFQIKLKKRLVVKVTKNIQENQRTIVTMLLKNL